MIQTAYKWSVAPELYLIPERALVSKTLIQTVSSAKEKYISVLHLSCNIDCAVTSDGVTLMKVRETHGN